MPAADGAFRQQIARHCLDLAVERMEPLPHWGWGGDSDAWLVNGTLIFRFPRTPDIAQQLRLEVCLLPQLAPLLPLAIPAFRYVASDPATHLPRFVGYSAIPGEPMTPALLDTLGMPEAERLALAAQMGGFLASLHGFPVECARECGAEEVREPDLTRALYERVRDLVYPRLAPPLRAWTDHLFGDYFANPGLWQFEPALIHRDLSSDHILFDRAARRITGIIDFGDLAIYDPVADFSGLAAYGNSFLEAALAAYTRPLGETARQRLAFYHRRVPYIALAWGAERSDDQALSEGMAALRAVVAERV